MKKIAVLGPGCPKCNQLMAAVEMAAKQLGMEYELTKITDIVEITGFGVMMTPALAVDGKVKVAGKVPSVDETQQLLQ